MNQSKPPAHGEEKTVGDNKICRNFTSKLRNERQNHRSHCRSYCDYRENYSFVDEVGTCSRL